MILLASVPSRDLSNDRAPPENRLIRVIQARDSWPLFLGSAGAGSLQGAAAAAAAVPASILPIFIRHPLNLHDRNNHFSLQWNITDRHYQPPLTTRYASHHVK